jgi:trehalose 6-phosphate phosphatase
MNRILPKLALEDRVFLFLDYDGTLVPIRPTPAEARPSEKMLALVNRLTQCASLKVAIISGRSLDDLFQLLPVDGLYLAGVHGVERYVPPGPPYFIPFPEKTRERVAEAAVRLSQKLPSGFLLENKGVALALHYRLAPPEAVPPVIDTFRGFCRALLPCPEWHVIEGRKVIEVRPADAGKGKAVEDFLSRWPGAFPVYLGDDTTDEDAFRFVRDKGLGILVAEKSRPTAATARLEDHASVGVFLRAVLSIFN